MGVDGQLHAPAALPPGKRPGTHGIEGWVGPRAGLDGCEKSRPHRDSILRPFSPYINIYIFCISVLTDDGNKKQPKHVAVVSCIRISEIFSANFR
jgi:hypothetical protein